MISWRQFKARRRAARALREIEARHPPLQPHGLDVPVTVSLTSYPARYATLAATLKSLLRQTVRADRTVLWLAHGDDALLPDDVRALIPEGLEVRTTENLRSYTKIIPSLRAFPDSAIVTADDDIYYPMDWLETLTSRRKAGGGEVLCHRAHRVALDDGGLPLPYDEWDWTIPAPERSFRVFPTGVLGVFYAPGCFHADVCRDDLFRALCPASDDIWLYWMHRMAGCTAEKVGPKWRILEWPTSQTTNLRTGNLGQSGNDRALAAMMDRYGFPSSEG